MKQHEQERQAIEKAAKEFNKGSFVGSPKDWNEIAFKAGAEIALSELRKEELYNPLDPKNRNWTPEPDGTTTAGISTVPSENTNLSDFDLWIERNGYAFTSSGYVKGSAIVSRGSLLNRYHAECQPSEKSGQKEIIQKIIDTMPSEKRMFDFLYEYTKSTCTSEANGAIKLLRFFKELAAKEIAKLLPSSPSGEKSGQVSTELIEALSYLQKFRQGYTLRDIDATQTDANKTLDALIQRIQDLWLSGRG